VANTQTTTMPELPAWLHLPAAALQSAWEQGQSAPPMDSNTRAALALLVR
jgi:hypothetical protein